MIKLYFSTVKILARIERGERGEEGAKRERGGVGGGRERKRERERDREI